MLVMKALTRLGEVKAEVEMVELENFRKPLANARKLARSYFAQNVPVFDNSSSDGIRVVDTGYKDHGSL